MKAMPMIKINLQMIPSMIIRVVKTYIWQKRKTGMETRTCEFITGKRALQGETRALYLWEQLIILILTHIWLTGRNVDPCIYIVIWDR